MTEYKPQSFESIVSCEATTMHYESTKCFYTALDVRCVLEICYFGSNSWNEHKDQRCLQEAMMPEETTEML